MRRYRFAPSAEFDLDAILSHIRGDDEFAAERWFSGLHEKCSLLAHSPRMGRIRDDLAPGLYMFPFGNHLILYDIAPNGIEIVHIMHGSRDVRRAIRND